VPPCNDGSHAQKAKPDTNATTLYMSDPPYENDFYSDRHVAAHVVVTSPIPDSDLSINGPRLIIAWPAENSGACMFFQPADGVNGSLRIKVINSTVCSPLAPVNIARNGFPSKEVEGVFQFDSAATLPLSILGSILEGHNGLDVVPVMNTDASVRMFSFNSTKQERLTEFLNNTALSNLRPYPAGLMTPVGVVVANPATSRNEIVSANFSNSAYHGSVVWSWQQVAMAGGLEKQLIRCSSPADGRPDFCSNTVVYNNVKNAYNALLDNIEKNEEYLSDEVWPWRCEDMKFKHTSLGSLPPPPGVGEIAESDVIQLWSLAFLAVKRTEGLR
jgi:hypothetical protein